MAIFKTAYDTTVGQGAASIIKSKIVHAIQESVIKDQIQIYDDGANSFEEQDELRAFFVSGQMNSEGNIPFFAHPLYFTMKNGAKEDEYIASDVRAVVSKKFVHAPGESGQFRIRNQGDFDFIRARTILNKVWLKEPVSIFRDISFVPCAMYTNWISEAIAVKYALHPKDKINLAIIAGIFYQCLFLEQDSLEEEDKQKITQAVSKATKAPASMVFDIVDQIEMIKDITDFCNTCKTILENERLQDFNAGILVTVVGNTWYGLNARETTAVALEHPPTWLALVFMSFTEKSFKNSALAKIATRYLGSKGENDYCRALSSIYRAHGGESQLKN